MSSNSLPMAFLADSVALVMMKIMLLTSLRRRSIGTSLLIQRA
jgi:hypothetical protein